MKSNISPDSLLAMLEAKRDANEKARLMKSCKIDSEVFIFLYLLLISTYF